MPEQLIKWIEIIFDILYLFTVWTLVALMYRNRGKLLPEKKTIGNLFTLAFFLLALGDTAHLGFRIFAYFMGGLEANAALVGAGSLATAVTVTFFYMAVVEIWRLLFNRKRGMIWWILIITGIIRLGIMIPAGNLWTGSTTPYSWSIARNIPLVIQGVGVAIALLVDGVKNSDKFAKKVSMMIFISYMCYAPVILFVRDIPMLGMLMIPKTIAYVAVAVITYIALFRGEKKI